MFYVKNELAGGITLHTEINSENTFTVCPECGIEFPVDLVDILSGGDADLSSTNIYCSECSKRRAWQCQDEPWAQQILREE